MSDTTTAKIPLLRRLDPAVTTAFVCIILLLLAGSIYSRNFLSPEYLLQQLKVASFLGVIASSDEEDRRRYERIPGRGQHAGLTLQGRAEISLPIHDISRGGISLESLERLTPGTEATVMLPATEGPVFVRVARCEGGCIGLAFRQDEISLRRIDAALRALGGESAARAA